MAVRKATMREQVVQAVAQANPSDRVHITVATVTGPTPWLSVGFLGLIGQFFIKYYFVSVTDQAVILHRLHRITQRPQEIVHAVPRAQFQGLVGEVQLNPLWSWFRMVLPGEAEATRFNVHRQWRAELEQLLTAVGSVPSQQPDPYAGQPPYQGQPPQQFPPQQPGAYQVPPQQPGYPQPPQQSAYQQPGYPQPGQPHQGNPYGG